MAIQKILCRCGSGLGSSLMAGDADSGRPNELGVKALEAEHSTVSDVTRRGRTLHGCSRPRRFHRQYLRIIKIVLSNILDK